MMQENKKREKKLSKTGKLYGILLRMTILPLWLSGIVIIAYSSWNLRNGMQAEISQTLRSVGISVLASYDALYEGDLNLLIDDENDRTLLRKGDAVISGEYQVIDEIGKQSEIEISVFFYNIRLLTTLFDAKGDRYIGNSMNQRVTEEVLRAGSERFYTNVVIDKTEYYAYYIPIFGRDGTCIGMIGTAKPATSVQKTLNGFVIKNMLLIIVAMILTAVFIAFFSSHIVGVIRKIMEFLMEMAKGNLSGEMDLNVVKRNDELGEMGRFTQKVQAALRKLIERDPLTNLYNRRSGEKRMQETMRHAARNGQGFALIFGDIDHFKKINDTYGHDFGDVVLVEVAKLLSDSMAGKGYVIRWGGEEFLIVMQDCDKETAITHVTHILEKIRCHDMTDGETTIRITMTFGVTMGTGQESLDQLVKAADELLYIGKEGGRNRICS
ncbi:MAG: diguanylate cyclase [Lachnospiraceae bacterium]|nr:diguanylate cyclase [Lachnospiraceae bacterium]